MKHDVDSLQSMGLPTINYQKRIDSIEHEMSKKLSTNQIQNQLETKQAEVKGLASQAQHGVQKKTDLLETNAMSKINEKKHVLDSMGISVKNPVDNLHQDKKSTPGLSVTPLPAQKLSLQVPGLPTGSALPQMKDVADPTWLKAPQVVGESEKRIADEMRTATKDLQKAKQVPKEVNDAKAKVKEAKSEMKAASLDKNKLKEMEKKAEKDLEQKAMTAKEVNGVKELKQKNPLEQYQEILKQIKKEKGSISGLDIKTGLPDPFVGKEEKLRAGITELDKLKKKYIAIPDSRYLPKRIPNQMKGKSFKERFVPALGFQLHNGTPTGLDLMPYFMYNLSGRVRLGAGFDYRLVGNSQTLVSSAQVFGFRALADFRFYGTWYFHVEGEWLHFERNSNLPRFPSDPMLQEWGDRLNVGILRTYKVSRRFNGMFEALYYAGDWRSFPQNKNASIRFGFEYKLGEKKRSPAMK